MVAIEYEDKTAEAVKQRTVGLRARRGIQTFLWADVMGGAATMTCYRLFFLNSAGKVIATDEFDAPRDPDATRMAVVLTDACGDQCSGFELWQAHRQVARRIGPILTPIVKNISARMDEATRIALRECAQRILKKRIAGSAKSETVGEA